MKDCKGTMDLELLARELREMIRAQRRAIFHALSCTRCGTRELALKVLGLVDWTEEEFLLDVLAQEGGINPNG